jgi:hypothetical protein
MIEMVYWNGMNWATGYFDTVQEFVAFYHDRNLTEESVARVARNGELVEVFDLLLEEHEEYTFYDALRDETLPEGQWF